MQNIKSPESLDTSNLILNPLDYMGIIEMLETFPIRNTLVNKAYEALSNQDYSLAESIFRQVYDLPLFEAIKDDLVIDANLVDMTAGRIGYDGHISGLGFMDGIGLIPMMYQSKVILDKCPLGKKTTLYSISPILGGQVETSIGIRITTFQNGVDINNITSIVPKEYPEDIFDDGTNIILLDKDNPLLI